MCYFKKTEFKEGESFRCIFPPPLFNIWYENVTEIIDIFGQMASTSIKHVQLADGCNPKYTLRHALGKGFKWVLLQGHVKVKVI